MGNKSKGLPANELIEIRQQIAELEASEAQCRRMQDGLQRRASEQENVFAALPAPVVLFDAVGRPVQANPAAIAYYGFDPAGVDRETLIRKLSIYHLDGQPVNTDQLPQTRALHGETVIDETLILANAEVGDRVVLASASPLMTRGKVAGAVSIWHDITERHRLLEQLRKMNEQLTAATDRAKRQAELARRRASQLETVIKSIADGVFLCDKEGRIIDVNEGGLRLIGLAKREEALRPLVDYLGLLKLRHLDGRPIATEELAMSRAVHGEIVSGYEEVARSLRTQRDIYLLVSAAPVRDREGNIIGAVEVVSDITRIREFDILKDQFISVAAHELKTPVAIMKGYAEAMLRMAEKIPPDYRKMLNAMDRGADRIDRIVRDLLDLSRLHLGYLELVVERIDLLELVQQVVDRMALTTTKHRIRVVRAEPVTIQGDRDRVEQVLINLLDNAIKYSPKGGDIDVEVAVRDHEAVVSVRDRGVGIPKDKQAHIFEHFYRAHTGTPYDYGGMGVGLYMSKELVSRHGGRIWFESEEGKGSTFYFSLPLA